MKFASLFLSAALASAGATGAHATKILFEDNGTHSWVYDNYAEWAADLAGGEVRLETFDDADLDPGIRALSGGTIAAGKVNADLHSDERWLRMKLAGASAVAFDLTELSWKGFPGIALSVNLGFDAGFYTYTNISSGFVGMISDARITGVDIVDRQGSGASQITLDNVYLLDAPAPEPATWAMSILGFGLVGAAARRRRSRIAFG